MSVGQENTKLLQQYEYLTQIRKQIDYCLESIEKKDELTPRLKDLNNLILSMDQLFFETSKISSLFSTKATLPHEIKEIIKEAKEIVELHQQELQKHIKR